MLLPLLARRARGGGGDRAAPWRAVARRPGIAPPTSRRPASARVGCRAMGRLVRERAGGPDDGGRVAVVGAGGLVGSEILEVLGDRGSSRRSALKLLGSLTDGRRSRTGPRHDRAARARRVRRRRPRLLRGGSERGGRVRAGRRGARARASSTCQQPVPARRRRAARRARGERGAAARMGERHDVVASPSATAIGARRGAGAAGRPRRGPPGRRVDVSGRGERRAAGASKKLSQRHDRAPERPRGEHAARGLALQLRPAASATSRPAASPSHELQASSRSCAACSGQPDLAVAA